MILWHQNSDSLLPCPCKEIANKYPAQVNLDWFVLNYIGKESAVSISPSWCQRWDPNLDAQHCVLSVSFSIPYLVQLTRWIRCSFQFPLSLALCGQSLTPKGWINWTIGAYLLLVCPWITSLHCLHVVYTACTMCQALFYTLKDINSVDLHNHLHGRDYYYPSLSEEKTEAQNG